MRLFLPNIFNLPERYHWVDFLLFVVCKIERFGCGVTLRFGGKKSGCFCVLKILIDSLVLSLGKNISIREAKSA